MRKITVLVFAVLFSIACGNAPQKVDVNVTTRNANDAVVSSHSSDNPSADNSTIVPRSDTKTKWTRGGDSIDVSEYNAEIAKAGKNLKAKPQDAAAKKALAEAYLKRAVALTEARQYASALGDFRRALKYDSSNETAKNGKDEIINIYTSMNREFPPEGEEPEPLPFGGKSENKTQSSAERISFRQGATSANVTGNLNNYKESKDFVIAVKQGQTLKTDQIKDDKSAEYITVSIKNPSGEVVGDMDASCHNRFEISPTVAGDYHLTVTECMKADEWRGKFNLKVSVE